MKQHTAMQAITISVESYVKTPPQKKKKIWGDGGMMMWANSKIGLFNSRELVKISKFIKLMCLTIFSEQSALRNFLVRAL